MYEWPDCGDDEAACAIVQVLAARGANQHSRNMSGERPVDTAHQRGNVALIRALNAIWSNALQVS